MTDEELGYFLFMDSIENRISGGGCASWENSPPISKNEGNNNYYPETYAPAPPVVYNSFGQNMKKYKKQFS